MLVVDTNIWISYTLNNKGITAEMLKAAIVKYSYGFSDETFRELTEVLLREKFDPYFSRESRVQMLKDIAREAKWFAPKQRISECRDFQDNKFLELALEANAMVVLTGDEDLLVLNPFCGIPIQKISDFTG